jgi:hypothetical protein
MECYYYIKYPQAHSSVEKAGLIGLVQMHYLESDPEHLSIDGKTLEDALERDRESGLIPFWVKTKSEHYHSLSFNVEGIIWHNVTNPASKAGYAREGFSSEEKASVVYCVSDAQLLILMLPHHRFVSSFLAFVVNVSTYTLLYL